MSQVKMLVEMICKRAKNSKNNWFPPSGVERWVEWGNGPGLPRQGDIQGL